MIEITRTKINNVKCIGTEVVVKPGVFFNILKGFLCWILQYTQSEENVMNIIVSALYTTGWVGIGFSRDGMMVGSSAMVGWVNKKGHARIHQYYLQGRKQSEVIQDKGELPLTNVPSSVVLHGATIYLAFQLKFSAMVSQQPILLAFGNAYPRHNHLATHSDKTAVVFDFSAGFFCCPHQNFVC